MLFRPFVEINGTWFWWGSPPASNFIAVWRETQTYLMTMTGLQDTLIWVYNVNAWVGNYTTY